MKVKRTDEYIIVIINGVDFYFNKDTLKYDGMGTPVKDGDVSVVLIKKEGEADMDELAGKLDEYGWPDIWHPDRDSWFVGVWHKNFDLLCVRWCKTEKEAEKWLSPEGSTLQEAIDKAEKLLKNVST